MKFKHYYYSWFTSSNDCNKLQRPNFEYRGLFLNACCYVNILILVNRWQKQNCRFLFHQQYYLFGRKSHGFLWINFLNIQYVSLLLPFFFSWKCWTFLLTFIIFLFVYSSMNFNTCVDLCNVHHHYQDSEQFHHPKELYTIFLSLPQPPTLITVSLSL